MDKPYFQVYRGYEFYRIGLNRVRIGLPGECHMCGVKGWINMMTINVTDDSTLVASGLTELTGDPAVWHLIVPHAGALPECHVCYRGGFKDGT